ncbi:MAG: radical SAM protein [Chloracidobacterium sp.]|uniref:Radical SAM protein n=1 Tax=Chloracidobacterium validum TaxID=2821543 RepID=A0ABX8BC55_9BACT|nr:radical SAM protein [Chloracidobacterium validum]QUW02655.1 radical SAM protein [Chloracidobacterium validum]
MPEPPASACFPVKRLTIGLTNLCNLDCDYCLRVAETQHLDFDLLSAVLEQARGYGVTSVTYTGGEVALHPRFRDVVHRTAELGFSYSFVTNGWHFPKIAPFLVETKAALFRIFFSMDGPTEALHDAVRGKGSFRKIMAAMALCRLHGFPFGINLVVTKRSVSSIEAMAVLGARLGADIVQFAHMLPTSEEYDQTLSLTPSERRAAEREALAVNAILNMPVQFAAGSSTPEPGTPCVSLSGETVNLDCRGRLTLCCTLSDFRNSVGEGDIVADMRTTSFREACEQVHRLAVAQRERRNAALAAGHPDAEFPCHFCVTTFDKAAWQIPGLVQLGRATTTVSKSVAMSVQP